MEVHLGIDLAWGTTAPSGLAAVDSHGRLIDSAAAVTDDEISGWLDRPDWKVLTAAVDAPLIVTNPTGQRRCELEVSRAYGAYGASCHASNLSRPYFNPPRAAVLASRMGWTLDPRHRGDAERAACIEVYPHAAMVGLFQLPAVLPYKGRGGRPLDVRRSAFLELLRRMEELAPLELPGSSRWAAICDAVENAGRPVHLERVEDEVDAIMCAHLAWLWHSQPASLTVYGSATDGYIVAPPPSAHAPTRRATSSGRRAH